MAAERVTAVVIAKYVAFAIVVVMATTIVSGLVALDRWQLGDGCDVATD